MPGRRPVENEGNFRDTGLKLAASRTALYPILTERLAQAAEGTRFAASPEMDVLIRGIAVSVEEWFSQQVMAQLAGEIQAMLEAERGKISEEMLVKLIAAVGVTVEPKKAPQQEVGSRKAIHTWGRTEGEEAAE